MHLLYEVIYPDEPLNNQYVIDHEHQSLIFAVGTEVLKFAFIAKDPSFTGISSSIVILTIPVRCMIHANFVLAVDVMIPILAFGPMENVH